MRAVDLAKTKPTPEKVARWLTETNDGEARYRQVTSARVTVRTTPNPQANPFVRKTIVDPVGSARREEEAA